MLRTPYIDTIEPLTLRKDKRPILFNSRYVTKIETYFEFPEITIENNIWRGASEMLWRYIYKTPFTMALRTRFSEAPEGTTLCLVISWKPTSETIVRYKLWKDVGEILFIPDYSGQAIKSFDGKWQLEIWNTIHPTLYSPEVRFYTTNMVVPEDFCDDEAIDLDLQYKICTDSLFPLARFNPIDGDYFVIVECDVTLIDSGLYVDSWLLRSDIGSWHNLDLTNIGGMIYSKLTDAIAPPPGTQDHLRLVDLNSHKVFAIRVDEQFLEGKSHFFVYVAEEIDINENEIPSLYIKADDGLYYGYRLRVGWKDAAMTIRDPSTTRIIVDQTPQSL